MTAPSKEGQNKKFRIIESLLGVLLFLLVVLWPSTSNRSVYPLVAIGIAMIFLLFLRFGGKVRG